MRADSCARGEKSEDSVGQEHSVSFRGNGPSGRAMESGALECRDAPADCPTIVPAPMTRVLRLPPRGRSGAWLVALGIGLVMAIQPIWKDNYAIGVTGLIALTLIACARWQLRWVPVVIVILCGVMLRWSVSNNHASDVSDVSRAALMVMAHGANTYGIGYIASNPPGAAFPYGPIDLFWYLPFLQDPTQVETLVTFALLRYFGVRAGHAR